MLGPGFGVEHFGFKYIGKLRQWLVAVELIGLSW